MRIYILTLLVATLAGGCQQQATSSAPGSEADCIDASKINPNGICTMDYTPVCGCDGKTYDNSCEADRAGVISYTQGACSGR